MLRRIRIGVAVAVLLCITLYMVDFAGWMPNEFHGLAHVQWVPALVGLHLSVLIVLMLMALLFGRLYCSVLCPLGILQDCIGRIAALTRKKRKKYHYVPARPLLRWSLLGGVTLAYLLGFTALLSLLDPYSAYGRVASHLFRPVYTEANNLLSSLFSSMGYYGLYQVDLFLTSALSLGVALLTLGVVGYMAWRYGRSYCNTICPVGTLLGFLSRFAGFRIRIDTQRCNSCGRCATYCKSSCIDSQNHRIDESRCVVCFDCIDQCKQGALHYKWETKRQQVAMPRVVKEAVLPQPVLTEHPTMQPEDPRRRQFLGVLMGSAVALPLTSWGEGLRLDRKKRVPMSPPGAQSNDRFNRLCTACHLCVSRCPSKVLQPALMEYGLAGVMQPTMKFEKGFCNYNCTICTEVCPNGALQPLTVEQKHRTQMGAVVFDREACIVFRDQTSCGACSEHCPTQAVTMVPYKEGLTIPETHPEICVGCGACEYVCPAEPQKAIHVEGHAVHQEAQAALPQKQQRKRKRKQGSESIQVEDFGF